MWNRKKKKKNRRNTMKKKKLSWKSKIKRADGREREIERDTCDSLT